MDRGSRQPEYRIAPVAARDLRAGESFVYAYVVVLLIVLIVGHFLRLRLGGGRFSRFRPRAVPDGAHLKRFQMISRAYDRSLY